MIKDLKLGLKLIKYGAQFKLNIISAAFLFVLAIIFELMSHGTTFIGAFYFLLVGVFPMQLIFSTDVSTMVQTSRMKRKIQITLPILFNSIIMGASVIFVGIVRYVEIMMYPEDEAMIVNGLILVGATSFCFLAYMGAAFKHFAISMIGFIVCYFAIYFPLFFVTMYMDRPIVPYPLALLICILCIAAGLGIQYVLLRLFYKHEMSKHAFGAQIRKLMN